MTKNKNGLQYSRKTPFIQYYKTIVFPKEQRVPRNKKEKSITYAQMQGT